MSISPKAMKGVVWCTALATLIWGIYLYWQNMSADTPSISCDTYGVDVSKVGRIAAGIIIATAFFLFWLGHSIQKEWEELKGNIKNSH